MKNHKMSNKSGAIQRLSMGMETLLSIWERPKEGFTLTSSSCEYNPTLDVFLCLEKHGLLRSEDHSSETHWCHRSNGSMYGPSGNANGFETENTSTYFMTKKGMKLLSWLKNRYKGNSNFRKFEIVGYDGQFEVARRRA